MIGTEVVKLEIPCSTEFVTVPRRTIEGIASRLSLTPEEIEDLKLAVGEACSNAVKFSGPNKPNVHVLYRIQGDRLEIEVKNSGSSFDGCEGRVNDRPIDPLTEGGLGLYLIEQIMDEISIKSNCGETTITMVKQINRCPE